MKPLGIFILLCSTSTLRSEKIVLVAGGDGPDGSSAIQAKLIQPFGVDFAPDGTIYIVEMEKGERLRAINAKGELITLAGTGYKGPTAESVLARKATFNAMHSLAVDPDGSVYLADTWNNCIRRFDPKNATVAPFAGTGEKGFSGDGGPREKATFGGCYCICFGPTGKEMFLADLDNRRIRRIDMATGTVSTVAGNGGKGVPKDGEDAVSQPLLDPRAVTIDSDGNLYILERAGHCLRVVDGKGKIHTVAGTGKPGVAGLGGKALEAQMNGPKYLSMDKDGSVLIADTENHRIVRYVPGTRKLLAVAGCGRKGSAGLGGDPLSCELDHPHGVIAHPKTGEIYISDSGNNRVIKITKQ